MRIDKYEYGEVRYIDCMNKENGLPTLEDKSIDLCLTDPPYNINLKGVSSRSSKKYKIYYKDIMEPNEYKKWSILWFNEIKRICKRIMFTPGNRNLYMWFEIEKFDMVYWHNPIKQGESKPSKVTAIEPILCYNVGGSKKKLTSNYLYALTCQDLKTTIHPCPKPLLLFHKIINDKRLGVESIIDPFLGSGTTAEVCTKLGIPWLGYELNEVYSQDIDKRLKDCKREFKPTQLNLEGWNL